MRVPPKKKKKGTKSQTSKGEHKPRTRRRVVRQVEFRDRRGFMRATDFDVLRGQDAFVDLIRVMRLSNVLTYIMDINLRQKPDDVTSSGRRADFRNHVNAGGYLHEGVKLIETLDEKHKGKAYFSPFRRLLSRLVARKKKILTLLRNNAAFHLDYKDYSTREAISNLNFEEYEFVAGDTNKLGDLYFNLPDAVDLNYIIDELKSPEQREREKAMEPVARAIEQRRVEGPIRDEIFALLADLLDDMVKGSQTFVTELSRRMGILR